ncbi:hypothetical protein UFOVP1311_40 [uncultured Caudovirales phage]|jgi:hypothetical protein|uniref:Uncharacterized protein n=1 Tax=uncultured Caudovirales phage TaxID=2100421 RepID=A0A6J5RK27_9CAUD|nr:hypothetical protein UFOVP1311_40 [uncultured Caudovirales phage]
MNFIEAITFYKNGEEIKRKGNALSLKPSYYLQKKLRNLPLDEREREHLRLSLVSFTEGDMLENDWIVVDGKE